MMDADRAIRPQPLSDLSQRSVSALTEYLYAFDDHGWAADAPGCWLVYAEDGSEYRVDAETGSCTCDDAFYRDPEGGCKHLRRVEFLTGDRDIPEWVDTRNVDPWLLRERDTRARGDE